MLVPVSNIRMKCPWCKKTMNTGLFLFLFTGVLHRVYYPAYVKRVLLCRNEIQGKVWCTAESLIQVMKGSVRSMLYDVVEVMLLSNGKTMWIAVHVPSSTLTVAHICTLFIIRIVIILTQHSQAKITCCGFLQVFTWRYSLRRQQLH